MLEILGSLSYEKNYDKDNEFFYLVFKTKSYLHNKNTLTHFLKRVKMEIKPLYQLRHEKLVDFLKQFSQYKSSDGKPILKKNKKPISEQDLKDVNINQINSAVVVFTDVLNIEHGSSGDRDLYRLMQAYLTIPEYRDKINNVIEEAHSFHFQKTKHL